MTGTARVRRMAPEFSLGRDAPAVRSRVEMMERLLERSFVLPGTNQPVGLDAIVGLVPVAGDAIGALMGMYLVWEARNLGMSNWQMSRMVGNVGIDALVGIIPFVGVVADFFFRSNTRNLKIIKKHLDRHHPGARTIEG